MNTNDILVAIDAEISRLQQARTLLSDTSPIGKRQPGRPAGSSMPAKVKAKRTLSAEAREKIAPPQRARWAKFQEGRKEGSEQFCCNREEVDKPLDRPPKNSEAQMSAGARAKIAAAQKPLGQGQEGSEEDLSGQEGRSPQELRCEEGGSQWPGCCCHAWTQVREALTFGMREFFSGSARSFLIEDRGD